MFILAGAIMEHGQISEALINWIKFFIGRVRGALGMVTIVASAAFGVITGSAMATISAIGRIMGPSLERNGYSKPYIGALLASCGFLGIMIPPSIPGIMYATASGENTSDVWISTIGAGLLFVILYCIINYVKMGRFETKEEAPKLSTSKLLEGGLLEHMQYVAAPSYADHYLRRHLFRYVHTYRGRCDFLRLRSFVYPDQAPFSQGEYKCQRFDPVCHICRYFHRYGLHLGCFCQRGGARDHACGRVGRLDPIRYRKR
jgi:Na+/H+ antiporter NhaC